jgi:hypothetical protein
MDDITQIVALAGNGLAPLVLVFAGFVFAWREIWPWFKERDHTHHERNAEIQLAEAQGLIALGDGMKQLALCLEAMENRKIQSLAVGQKVASGEASVSDLRSSVF